MNGSNVYDLWVTKWPCRKAFESEFGYPW